MRCLLLPIICAGLLAGCCSTERDLTQYVNAFVGSQHEGHTFPGATAPGGMVQASPESTRDHYVGYEMDHVAGYQYDDPYIWGFTQTHFNGAGCPSLSDILLLPYCKREIDPSLRENFRSTYNKANETASPGYYAVKLDDHSVKVELTATPHAAYHRYTFDDPESAKLLIDLQYGVSWDIKTISENILEASQQFEDEYTLTGYRKAREWAARKLFYIVKFNKPKSGSLTLATPEGKTENAPRFLIDFVMGNTNQLEVLIGLSTVSIEQAKLNLEAEISKFDSFDAVREQTRKQWNDVLSKVEVQGNDEQLTAFYTSLYHLYIQPNNIADISGSYRAANDTVYTSPTGKYYTATSFWDTYRAANPFYSLMNPEIVNNLVVTAMESFSNKTTDPSNPKEANKYFPRWELWGVETHTMIGNHAIPMIVDACMNGIYKEDKYSQQDIFDAIWITLTKPHYRNHVELIDQYGYIPYDVQLSNIDDSRETVARLLEGCYDDYCASLLADKLGLTEQRDFLRKRSANYKNVYDTKSGFMRGRNSKGEFRTDVDSSEVVGEWVAGSDFTEGNAWHYRFHVQHDVEGMIEMMGGAEAVGVKLDSMFYTNGRPEVKTLVWNIYGTIGQYWHGNEPCNHVAYLYKFTDRPHKADAILKCVVDNFYKNTPDGLKGNDDCGQMSAWHIFTSLGFYPIDPCSNQYVIGAPQLPSATLNLPNGKKFTIVAEGLSNENHFVKSVSLNGKTLEDKHITRDQILSGGELRFVMRGTPDNGASDIVINQ